MGKWEKIGSSDDLIDALHKFDKADVNNDHKISKSEFITHMNLCKLVTACDWSGLFDELDVDKNGTLSHSEFWTKMVIRNSDNLVEALNMFDKADKNNDHKISREEFIVHMKLMYQM